MTDLDLENVVLDRLALEFPRIPRRIIAEIVAAYCRGEGGEDAAPGAEAAARQRIQDAYATH